MRVGMSFLPFLTEFEGFKCPTEISPCAKSKERLSARRALTYRTSCSIFLQRCWHVSDGEYNQTGKCLTIDSRGNGTFYRNPSKQDTCNKMECWNNKDVRRRDFPHTKGSIILAGKMIHVAVIILLRVLTKMSWWRTQFIKCWKFYHFALGRGVNQLPPSINACFIPGWRYCI